MWCLWGRRSYVSASVEDVAKRTEQKFLDPSVAVIAVNAVAAVIDQSTSLSQEHVQ